MAEPLPDLIEELLETTAGRLEDVAAEAGVSYSALYSWATGRRSPSAENLERLAELARERADRLDRVARQLSSRLDGEAPGHD